MKFRRAKHVDATGVSEIVTFGSLGREVLDLPMTTFGFQNRSAGLHQTHYFVTDMAILRVVLGMNICTSARINDALIEIEDLEERDPENRYIVVWRNKDEENRYAARSLEDAEEYYRYRCCLAEQGRI